jgi:hypothetical protein
MIGTSLATVVFFTIVLVTVVYQMSARSYSLRRLHECGAKITYDYESSKRDVRSYPPFSFLFDRDDWAPVWEISIKNYDSELDLAVLSCFRELEELQLYGITDADLHRMPILPRVRVATIDCRRLTEDGFAALDALEYVELIIFDGSPITEQGFRGVAEMPRLKGIGFWGNKLSCIRHFGKQDNLVAVSIRDPIADLPAISLPEHLNIDSLIISATDLDISLLEGLLIPALANLELDSNDGWQFRTDRPYSRLEGLEHFSRLRSLRVFGFAISEEWLRTYVGRNAVEQLKLSYCDLDPSFFSALSTWQSLVHLDLYRVKIQPVAVAVRPPRLETFKLTNSEVGSLNFLNDSSFDSLRERIVEHNTNFGSGQEINSVQEYPMNNVDSKD